MGIIHSIVCAFTFCLERILTWTCCGFLLILLMLTIVTMMIYGIAVGYHYAQKEIELRGGYYPWWRSDLMRSDEAGGGRWRGEGDEGQPDVRLLGDGNLPEEEANDLITTFSPPALLKTDRRPNEPELSLHEKELARRLIGRIRRSRNNSATAEPFLRPLRALNVTDISSVLPLT